MVLLFCSLTERFNQTLVTHLMKVVNEESTDWDDHIQSIVFAYRVNRQESTKFTPFELMYGVKARLPIDLEGERDTNRPTENEEVSRQRVADLAESLSTRRKKQKTTSQQP